MRWLHIHPRGPNFFSFWKGGGGGGCYWIFVAPNVFPSSSQYLLNMFLKFPIATHFVPCALPTVVLLKLPNLDRWIFLYWLLNTRVADYPHRGWQEGYWNSQSAGSRAHTKPHPLSYQGRRIFGLMCFYTWSEECFITGESLKFQNFGRWKRLNAKKTFWTWMAPPTNSYGSHQNSFLSSVAFCEDVLKNKLRIRSLFGQLLIMFTLMSLGVHVWKVWNWFACNLSFSAWTIHFNKKLIIKSYVD
jgi:hypothetical protein